MSSVKKPREDEDQEYITIGRWTFPNDPDVDKEGLAKLLDRIIAEILEERNKK